MKHTEYIIPIGEEAKDFDEIFIGVLRKHKELIRCKDCKHWNEYYRECDSPNWDTGTDDRFVVPAGFYCGWAERKGK